MKRNHPPRERGLSLIEVLVAIVVLSVGLLAMAGLQLTGLRASQGAGLRAQAATLASDMAERMRANLADASNYDINFGDAAPGGTSVREQDIAEWLRQIAALPAGAGQIEVDMGTRTALISVRWDDTRASGPAADGSATLSQFSIRTRLWNM